MHEVCVDTNRGLEGGVKILEIPEWYIVKNESGILQRHDLAIAGLPFMRLETHSNPRQNFRREIQNRASPVWILLQVYKPTKLSYSG